MGQGYLSSVMCELCDIIGITMVDLLNFWKTVKGILTEFGEIV